MFKVMVSYVVLSLLISVAKADPAGIYMGTTNGSGRPCNLRLSKINSSSSSLARTAYISNWRFYTVPSRTSGCRTYFSNQSAGSVEYPDFVTKLRVHLNEDCSKVEYYEFQNGVNSAQSEAFSCFGLTKISEN